MIYSKEGAKGRRLSEEEKEIKESNVKFATSMMQMPPASMDIPIPSFMKKNM